MTESVVLSVLDGKPVMEISDHKGKPVLYRYTIRALRTAWVVRLVALDEAGEPARDRAGRKRAYLVTFSALGEWCQCPDYTTRRLQAGERCKHLRAAAALKEHWEAMQEATENGHASNL